jgi:hypothetical protein
MSNHGPHARFLLVIDAWRNHAQHYLLDIETWRNSAAISSRQWPEDEVAMFGLSTSEIAAWFLLNRPLVDFQPVIRAYELAQKWTADKNAVRLPLQNDVATQFDLADLLVFSLRMAISIENDKALEVQAKNGKAVKAKPLRDKALEDRDRWIYAECCRGTAYDTIASKLTKKPQDWPRIESKQGIQNAAKKYAERNGLPPIPRRQE